MCVRMLIVTVFLAAALPTLAQEKSKEPVTTHQSVIKTTFLLYFATPAGMMALCDATGAVSIIGRWKPFV